VYDATRLLLIAHGSAKTIAGQFDYTRMKALGVKVFGRAAVGTLAHEGAV
jgi:hypothetical protein